MSLGREQWGHAGSGVALEGTDQWLLLGLAPSTHSPFARHVAGGWKGFSPPTALSRFQELLLFAFIFLRASAG